MYLFHFISFLYRAFSYFCVTLCINASQEDNKAEFNLALFLSNISTIGEHVIYVLFLFDFISPSCNLYFYLALYYESALYYMLFLIADTSTFENLFTGLPCLEKHANFRVLVR